MLPPLPSLTQESLFAGVDALTDLDPDLKAVVTHYGSPSLWAREPGFPTLIYIILEQQVSLASARAAFTRLNETLTPLTPQSFLTLETAELKTIGFSRQKTAYGRGLAEAILSGSLDLSALANLPDPAVHTELVKLKGIGRWTTDIYLLMALLRPDIWPTGDLALAISVQRVKHLPTTPTPAELTALGEAYRPWRAVATRIFWHDYLSTPGKTPAVP